MAITPHPDVVMIQEHKLRGNNLDNQGSRLILSNESWILAAAPGERSWINPNVARKGGVGIIIASKFTKLVTMHGALYDNRVVGLSYKALKVGI